MYRTMRSAVVAPLVLTLAVAGCATSQKPSEPAPTHADPEVISRVMAAEVAGQEGRYLESGRLYVEAAELTDDAELAARAAEVAIYTGDKELVTRAVRRWVELEPSSEEAQKIAAGVALDRGTAAEAVEHLDAVFALREDDDQVWRLTAQLLNNSNAPQTRVQVLEMLLPRMVMADDETRLRLSYLAIRDEQPDLALAIVDVVGLANLGPELLQWRAQLNLSRRDLTAAAEDYRRLLAIDEGSTEARLSYASVLYQLGDAEAARSELAKLPETAAVLYSRGLYALEAKDTEGAEQVLDQLLAMETENPDERAFFAGQLLEMMGDLDRAEEQYRAVRSGARYVTSRQRLAVLLEHSERLDEAIAVLRALQNGAEADAVQSFIMEAEILNRNDAADAAMRTYARGLLYLPDHPDLLYARALQAERMDQIEQTEKDLRRIIETDPNNANALNALGYTLADRTDRFTEAKGYIQQALDLDPDNAAIVDSMGWVQYRLGNLEEAETWLRRALELQFDSEVAAHLGEVLWVAGRREEARGIWDEALQRDPEAEAVLETVERLTVSRRRCAFGLLLGALVLAAGCQTPGRKAGASAPAERLEARVAIRHADEGGSGKLIWRRWPGRNELEFIGALGQGHWQLTTDRRQARFRAQDGTELRAADVQTLMEAQLGWSVPIESCWHWLHGRPASHGSPAHLDMDNDASRPVALTQDGWTVRYADWRTVADEQVPTRLEITRGDLRLRVRVSAWDKSGT